MRGVRGTLIGLVATALLAAGCGGGSASTTVAGTATSDGGTLPPVPVEGGRPGTTLPPMVTVPDEVENGEPLAVYDVVEVHDPLINDLLALTVLVPEGWQSDGGIAWDPDLFPLAGAVLTISDPSGAFALETYFPQSYAWVDDPAFQNPGSNWLGSIMAPPRSATDAVVDLVLPTIRPGAQVVGSTPLDTSFLEGTTEGARVRVSYQGIEEDFVAATAYATAVNAGTTFAQWGFQILYSVRAPAGQLDVALPVLETIAASFSIDPLWYANYLTVVDLFIQRGYESIRLAGELSEYITRTYDEISRIHREAWEEQQRTYDRIFDNFSDYIRGTQKVNNNGTVTRTPQGVACRMPDGTIVVFPHGSSCPPAGTQLPTVQ